MLLAFDGIMVAQAIIWIDRNMVTQTADKYNMVTISSKGFTLQTRLNVLELS